MIQNHSPLPENRQITLTEFGCITALDELDETVEISNDDGKKTFNAKDVPQMATYTPKM